MLVPEGVVDGEDGVPVETVIGSWIGECVEGFVDFDVAGKGVVSGALAGEGVDVGEVFESFYRI